MDQEMIKAQTATATKWSTISELATKCVVPITNMILARLLEPEAFGVVATVTMVVSFADIFTDAGFQKYLIQHDFETEELLDKHTNVAFWTNLCISLIIWLIICIFSTPIANAVGNPGLEIVIIVSSCALPLTSFSSIQSARFKRDFNFKALLPIRLAGVVIPFFVTIPLALIFRSYWALVIGSLVNNFTVAVLLTIKSKWKPKFYYSFQVLKEMFAYSWWILLESISIWATSYIDTFIVGIFLTTYYVGLYKTAMSTVNQIMGLITAATSLPLFAALSRLKNDNTALIQTYFQYVRAVSCIVIPLGFGIWLYRDLVVAILLGPQWEEATDFVGLWGCIYSFTIALGSYCNGLYNAIGKTYLSFVTQILQLIVLIPVLLISVRGGYDCLFFARSIARLEIIIVQLIMMKIIFKIKISKQITTVLPATIGSMIMVVASALLKSVSTGIIWQFASVFVCIVVYFSFMFIAYRKIMIEALQLFGIKRMYTIRKRCNK